MSASSSVAFFPDVVGNLALQVLKVSTRSDPSTWSANRLGRPSLMSSHYAGKGYRQYVADPSSGRRDDSVFIPQLWDVRQQNGSANAVERPVLDGGCHGTLPAEDPGEGGWRILVPWLSRPASFKYRSVCSPARRGSGLRGLARVVDRPPYGRGSRKTGHTFGGTKTRLCHQP